MISTHTKSEEAAPRVDRKAFGYMIHDLARLLRRRFDAAAQHYGLTLPQWRVIGQLSLHDGISQVALAGLTDTDPMTVSGLVERLETKGLVVRVADPDDSRAKIVKITDKAQAMVVEMKRLADSVYAEVFEGISDAERATALTVLQQMGANLSKSRASGKENLGKEELV
jgi:MarR family transcriptional regulator for hemolysin